MKPSKDIHVLVVDDNRINRLILGRGLESLGYSVIEADSGESALELLSETLGATPDETSFTHPIDLVLLDIMMPGMDGNEVLAKIRGCKSRLELPVIMATAMDTTDDIVASLNAGANDYITKPVNLPVVFARIETHLSLRATHRALKSAQHSIIRSAKMESVSYLAAGVAHEIRNPLARINMTLPILARSEAVSSDEKLSAALEKIRRSLKKADGIVRSLMQFSSENRLKLEPHDVRPAIQEALSMLDQDLAGVEVETAFQADLPPALFAPTELSKVFIAILLNAVQAMEGKGEISVTTSLATVSGLPPDEGSRSGIRLRNGDEAVFIEFLDSGPGLSEDVLEKIFDAFFTTKPADMGTGMGLSVARKIIDLHGGLLRVENRNDTTGARAYVFLRKAGSFETMV